MAKIVSRIVLTGGPCAGKTKALDKVEKHLSKLGYKVIIVPEAATMMINGGLKCFGDKCINTYDFQDSILKLQLQNERLFEQVALSYPDDCECVVIYDRGLMDNRAYINGKDFDKILLQNGVAKLDLIDHYDMVLHMVTAADGAESFYTLANNEARTETIEEARALDKRTMNAWRENSNLYIIDNNCNFETKLNNVIKHIDELLANPYRTKERRRYLVDITSINSSFFQKLSPLKIEQSYLQQNDEGYERRLRKRVLNGYSTYSLTVQKQNIFSSDIYSDRRITEEYYYDLLHDEKSFISKTRYSFISAKEKYNMDVFDNGTCILETTNNDNLHIDSRIKVLEDITSDESYCNYSMSKKRTKILIPNHY